jgi:hypothetical protein
VFTADWAYGTGNLAVLVPLVSGMPLTIVLFWIASRWIYILSIGRNEIQPATLLPTMMHFSRLDVINISVVNGCLVINNFAQVAARVYSSMTFPTSGMVMPFPMIVATITSVVVYSIATITFVGITSVTFANIQFEDKSIQNDDRCIFARDVHSNYESASEIEMADADVNESSGDSSSHLSSTPVLKGAGRLPVKLDIMPGTILRVEAV